jgi:tRNA A37 threonylcarbamoyladenosine modification protein TsaB
MTTLVIECSSAQGSLAFCSGESVIKEVAFENPRGRGSAFFAALAEILPGGAPLGRILVGVGPGGYNSLRVALASAWGIARARGARLEGISSMLAFPKPDYDVIGDARANQMFHAVVRNDRLIGEVALRSAPEIAVATAGAPLIVHATGAESTLHPPSAAVLFSRRDQLLAPVPVYLKPPHITKPVP